MVINILPSCKKLSSVRITEKVYILSLLDINDWNLITELIIEIYPQFNYTYIIIF